MKEKTLSVKGKGKDISDDDLYTVGINAGMTKKKCKEILNEIRQMVKDIL